MKKRLTTSLLLTTLLLSLNAQAQVTPYLDMSYNNFQNWFIFDSGDYQGARLGGGIHYQAKPQSWFFTGLEGHMSFVSGTYQFGNNESEHEQLLILDINGMVGAHLGQYVDLDLKLGAWLNNSERRSKEANVEPYFGLGLGVNLNQHFSIIADIKTVVFVNSASIGLKYNF